MSNSTARLALTVAALALTACSPPAFMRPDPYYAVTLPHPQRQAPSPARQLPGGPAPLTETPLTQTPLQPGAVDVSSLPPAPTGAAGEAGAAQNTKSALSDREIVVSLGDASRGGLWVSMPNPPSASVIVVSPSTGRQVRAQAINGSGGARASAEVFDATGIPRTELPLFIIRPR